jgi:hypothetical protein
MRVTGWFTLAARLAPNQSPSNIRSQVLDFSFSSGRLTLDSSNPNVQLSNEFWVGTDSSGDINEWWIRANDALNPEFLGSQFGSINSHNTLSGLAPSVDVNDHVSLWQCILFEDAGHGQCNLWQNDVASSNDNPGIWSVIPEPSTGLLLATGLATLGAMRGRKSRT